MSTSDGRPPESDDDGWGQAADLEKTLSEQKQAEEDPDRAAPVDPLAQAGAASSTDTPPGSESTDSVPDGLEQEHREHDVTEAEWGDDLTPIPHSDESPAEAAGVARRRGIASGSGRGGSSPARRIATLVALALILLTGGGVLSWWNHQHFYYVCGTKSVTAQRGSMWPWGRSPLDGATYRPISIPREMECQSREVANLRQLEERFLDTLLERASERLLSGDAESVAQAEKELQQAMLLARDPERRDRRKRIERLLGDVEYWRAAAEIRTAIETLEVAAKRFDEAASRRPQHSSDAAIWGGHARGQAAELRLGPVERRKLSEEPPGEPQFTGTDPDSADTDSSGADDRSDEPPPSTAPVPDAGLPRGGVLL